MGDVGYYLDLKAFSLVKLKDSLVHGRLLPSQQILLEKIDERFARLDELGFENLGQLQQALKTKSKVQSFAEDSALSVDYLTVLRREVNSYQPKPIKLSDFPGVNPDAVAKLNQLGMKNTKQLFPHVLTREDRRELAEKTQIDEADILELTKLTDVARTKWVGPKFARLLIESEYDTVEKVAGSDYEELYRALVRVNEKKELYQGKFGLDDMKAWVTMVVQDVPLVIRY